MIRKWHHFHVVEASLSRLMTGDGCQGLVQVHNQVLGESLYDPLLSHKGYLEWKRFKIKQIHIKQFLN